MLKSFAFIGRHNFTNEEFDVAYNKGICLFIISDIDSYTVTPEIVHTKWRNLGLCGKLEGVIVENAHLALNLCEEFIVGVFRNDNIALEGENPQFVATDLDLWDYRK